MKHLFLPYKLALIAKKKGFDEPCFGWYYWNKTNNKYSNLLFIKSEIGEGHKNSKMAQDLAAPLYQQIIDWLEVKGIYIRSYPSLLSKPIWWDWEIQIKFPYQVISSGDEEQYETKYLALDEAIKQAFKLI